MKAVLIPDLHVNYSMTTVVLVLLAVSMAIVGGCSPDTGPGGATSPQTEVLPSTAGPPTPDIAEKTGPLLLEVKQFALAEENLRLDYRVSNVSPHDVWVCVNMSQLVDQNSRSSVDAEIRDRTLYLRRRACLEQTALVNAVQIHAVYHRLQPGASRSDTLLLPLPVEDRSYVRFVRTPVKRVVLNQVVLELGYFGEELRDLVSNSQQKRRNAYFRDPDTAFISYIAPYRWDELHLEQSVKITISDVNVPGKIPG